MLYIQHHSFCPPSPSDRQSLRYVHLYATAQLDHGETHIWIGMNREDGVGSGRLVNLVHTHVFNN
jgi:hypothetical protein